MSIVGIFNKTRPQIRGIFFDAILEESSELRTDISEYPLENAMTANDNAVTRPLTVTMTVAVSDNPIKALIAETGQYSGILGVGAGVATGLAASVLPGGVAALAGVAASIGFSVAPLGEKRSQTILEEIRWSQRNNEILTVTGTSAVYDNMIITNTRTTKNKDNQGGLELVVEMRQLKILKREHDADTINANLPTGDSASTQGQATINHGKVLLQ
ncbi:hypothetical protein CKY10_01340 [Photorhabdus sp. HUG-39]|uniref:Dit-like phage tail protein N-terminal domain-containing protein n=1 Tax=Photorhabdus kayaii TaxID=230088 RepID=A0ABX0AVH0_9GAMM|nr:MULTISPECIES: hypothetical protein [Photorhabdus]MCC8375506.1 hypothetical protein [Photorhabdus bodei]NDL10224.1 hypothetical protein [Photorhabdus kayaii]NDL23901.1 hypothetical protein [Photorhabdus kayaii]RAX12498.1 hypothetical protein CKY10_01340 [Photorhabdus sp. HUG-39]